MNVVPANALRIRRYLQAIEEAGGRAQRWDLYKIAGNEENLHRWETRLCDECHLIQRQREGDKVYYVMTENGRLLNSLLRNAEYLGPLFEELGRERLRSRRWL